MQPLVNKKTWDNFSKSYVIKPVPWKWSYSKLEQWLTCRYKMYREHVLLDVVEGKNNAFAIGSGLHDALEQMVIDNADGTLQSPDYYIDIYRKSCLKSKDLADPSYVDKYPWMIENYMIKSTNMPVPLKRKNPIVSYGKTSRYWTEFFGTLYWDDTYNGGDIQLTIKGDVLTKDYENVDWKSASTAYKDEDMSDPYGPKALQLVLYSYWVYLEFAKIAPAKWIVLRKDCKKIHPYSFTPTEEIFDGLAKHMNQHNRDFISALQDPNLFYRTGNGTTDNQCRWCNYKLFCR